MDTPASQSKKHCKSKIKLNPMWKLKVWSDLSIYGICIHGFYMRDIETTSIIPHVQFVGGFYFISIFPQFSIRNIGTRSWCRLDPPNWSTEILWWKSLLRTLSNFTCIFPTCRAVFQTENDFHIHVRNLKSFCFISFLDLIALFYQVNSCYN